MQILSAEFERVFVGCEDILDGGVESGAGFGYLARGLRRGGEGSG